MYKRNVFWLLLLLLFSAPWLFSILENVFIGAASVAGILLSLLIFTFPIYFVISLFAEKDKKKSETKIKEDVKQEKPAEQPAQVTPNELDQHAEFIENFKKLDVVIEHEKISNELVKAQNYLRELIRIEKDHPEIKDRTRKLYSYYLPMLENILKEYVKLLDNGPDKEQLNKYEDRILQTVQLVNGALDSISLELLQQYYDSMNTDMKTLESLLKKDGLINEMNINCKANDDSTR